MNARRRRQVRIAAAALTAATLGACELPGGGNAGGRTSDDVAADGADTSDAAGARAADSGDSGDRGDASPQDLGADPRGALACDDDQPCTSDALSEQGCVHAPLAGDVKCDDGDPCTHDDFCADKQCKGYTSVCDDGVNCTLDRCKDGGCVSTHNMHWDCLPMVTLDAPPRALRSDSASAAVVVKGQVGSAKAKLGSLWINDVEVKPAGTGLAFEAVVALSPGQTMLRIRTIDELGGQRLRVQGVRWAAAWAAEGAAVPAATLQLDAATVNALQAAGSGGTATEAVKAWLPALQKALAGAPPAQPRLLAPPAPGAPEDGVAITLTPALAMADGGTSAAPLVAVAWSAAAVEGAEPASTTEPLALGVPLQGACAAAAKVTLAQASTAWTLRADGWNALLHAAWRGGQLNGDLSAAVRQACQGLACTATLHGAAPWQLDGCAPGGPRLRLADLRIDAVVPGTDLSMTAWLAIDGNAVVEVVNGVVTLRLGADVQTWVEVAAIPAPLWDSDFQEGVQALATAKLLPLLIKRAQTEGVARWVAPSGQVDGGATAAAAAASW